MNGEEMLGRVKGGVVHVRFSATGCVPPPSFGALQVLFEDLSRRLVGGVAWGKLSWFVLEKRGIQAGPDVDSGWHFMQGHGASACTNLNCGGAYFPA